MGWQWHQLDHKQIICTSLQADNHASTSSQIFWMLFLMPNQQFESTEVLCSYIKEVKLSIQNCFQQPCFTPTQQHCKDVSK